MGAWPPAGPPQGRPRPLASSTSLLEFAIAASIAIVPIMLAIVLLVAVVRPAAPGAAGGDAAERYLSVRHIAALKTFEAAIVRRPTLAATTAASAAQVLEGLPQCRSDWGPGGQGGAWLTRVGWRPAASASPADRVAGQLATLDAALLAFSSRANRRVGEPVGFDAARWFAAAGVALAAPVDVAGYPGQQFRLGCADLGSALAALARSDAAMLESLAWRGSEGSVTLARWRPEQEMEVSARQVMRRNPWGGLPGCIYLGRNDATEGAPPSHFVAGARSVHQRVCALPAMHAGAEPAPGAAPPATGSAPIPLAGEPGLADPVDDTRWSVPPSLQTMLLSLEPLRQPAGAGPNRIVVDGSPVDVGLSIALTIDPALQALAQKTAACYTGRHDVCRALGMRRAEDAGRPIGEQLLEGAMVRMAAVAVIDVASGRIEALAGALSPCTRQELDGPGRDAGCDTRLPYPVQYRADALLNPAVFHDAMPASTIKPIMAASFLTDPGAGARWLAGERAAMQRNRAPARDSLRGQLMRSDSARFLDRMFCFDHGFADCRRAWDVQTMASALGWNEGCGAGASECGRHDLLFGRGSGSDIAAAPGGARAPATSVSYGRLMSEPRSGTPGTPGAPMRLRPPAALDPAIVRRCAAGADGRRLSDDDWEKCRGGAVVDVVAEGWGQGHARASALGIAGMMATLAAAANGQSEVRRPHLVESLHGVATGGATAAGSMAPSGRATAAGSKLPSPDVGAQPNRLPRDAAEVILSGLSYSHRSGSARSACEQVFDARRCREIDWLAGKTGTPSFPSDGMSLDELARLCRHAGPAARPATGVCSSLRPYKWYVAAWRADAAGSGPWTKAIAVLSERNWLRRSGQVHGVGDQGPNPSAEIAMQIAGRQLGLAKGVRLE